MLLQLLVAGVTFGTDSSRVVMPDQPLAVSDSAALVVPAWRLGLSGKLRVVVCTSNALEGEAPVQPVLFSQVVDGLNDVGLKTAAGDPVALVRLVSVHARERGAWQGYRVGLWPSERKQRSRRAPITTAPPDGFIIVTEANQHTRVSERFTLRDFLTHDQANVWPKALVLEPRLLDKLELIADELKAMGRPSTIRVMSGFRTPQYNAHGAGRRAGRARDSRHMYGDAADIYIDDDGDLRMDDLNGDGRINAKDAHFLRDIADRIEQRYPELIGGLGTYRTTRTHGPYLHVDARGTRARWGR